jgi:hypothetical protein
MARIHAPHRSLNQRSNQVEGFMRQKQVDMVGVGPRPKPSSISRNVKARGYQDTDAAAPQDAKPAPRAHNAEVPGLIAHTMPNGDGAITHDGRSGLDRAKAALHPVKPSASLGGATSTIKARVFGRSDNPPAAPGRAPSRSPKTLVD